MASKKSFAIAVPALALALFATACGDRPEAPPVGPDCNASAGDDFSKVFVTGAEIAKSGGEGSAVSSGFTFGDTTPGAVRTWQELTVDGSTTCGDMQVIDIKNSGQNDYGASFFLLLNGFDATGTDGLSFWAKAPLAASNNTLTLLVVDKNEIMAGGKCIDPPIPPDALIVVTGTDQSATPTTSGMSATNTPNYEPPPGSCGNFFQYIFQFTSEWKLYRLPWNLFWQSQQPNRSGQGVDPSSLYEIGFQIPKEAHFEMWIDQVGAYKLASAPAGP